MYMHSEQEHVTKVWVWVLGQGFFPAVTLEGAPEKYLAENMRMFKRFLVFFCSSAASIDIAKYRPVEISINRYT